MNLPTYILTHAQPSSRAERDVVRRLPAICAMLLANDYLPLDDLLTHEGDELIHRALLPVWGRKLHELRFGRRADDWRLFIYCWNEAAARKITMPDHSVDETVGRLMAGAKFDFEKPSQEHAEMVRDAIQSAKKAKKWLTRLHNSGI